METPTIKIPNMGARQPDVRLHRPPRPTVRVLVIDAQSILGYTRPEIPTNDHEVSVTDVPLR